ncbi:chemotaxis-specific protein-glutamate methyltransferase CheB [Ramlibacter sp. MAHUQ-53]|uniref:chemotaxis-specific protein-glutamate methyltransferase CheB n=1 Tax=unclassified Ramlibacter TaxID=2617605 RepID=UPI0036278C12
MIRLLISDDSAFMRIAIRKMAESDPEIQIVGEARTGQMCVDMARELRPDVITMDVEMPVMDGLEATRQIMASAHPCPIIMLSSLTERNSVTTIKALELGAADFIAKKSSFVQLDIVKIGGELVEKIRFWAKQKSRLRPPGAALAPATPIAARPAVAAPVLRRAEASGPPGVVVVGISTGGPATLPQMLKAMGGALRCPMVVAQHMPPMFTSGFAAHLRNETGLDVVESTDGMELPPGRIVIIKGGTDAVLREPLPGKLTLFERTSEGAPIHPNADVLFRSAAALACRSVAVVMTGMGSDGTQGAKDLVARKASPVYAQDPNSCIVDGMPGSIINAGLATAILDPQGLGARLARLAGRGILPAAFALPTS